MWVQMENSIKCGAVEMIIKCRAWNKVKKVMIDPQDLIFHEHTDVEDHFSNDELIFMLFTGLKDKKGKEIFDGDVISYWDGTLTPDKKGDTHLPDYPPFHFSKSKNKISEIIYESPSFRISKGNPLGSRYLKNEEIEKIGNIYENPELINK